MKKISIEDFFGQVRFRSWEEVREEKAISWAEFRHYMAQTWGLSQEDDVFELIQAYVPSCEDSAWRFFLEYAKTGTANRPPTLQELERVSGIIRRSLTDASPRHAKPCQACWGHHPLGQGTGPQGGLLTLLERSTGKRYLLTRYQPGGPAAEVVAVQTCQTCHGKGVINEYTVRN